MLNSESILSLGYSPVHKDNWIGWRDFIKDEMNPSYGYFLRHSVHLPRGNKSVRVDNDLTLIYVHRHYRGEPEDRYIDSEESEGESVCVFRGKIDTVDELEVILSKYLKIKESGK